MPKKKSLHEHQVSIGIGDIRDISGKVTIAGGDVYEGYTAEQVSILLTQITSNYKRKPFDGRSPYKGPEVFEEEDANLFFGRERLVEDLVNCVDVLDLVVAMLGNPLSALAVAVKKIAQKAKQEMN